MLELNKIYLKDCISGMILINNNIIDLTVTSPPYDNLRTYNNTLNWNFEKFKLVSNELYRITKDGGVIVWIVNDSIINKSESGSSFKQALYFKEIGFNLHDTMIYQKRNFSHPEKTRYHSVFEYMFVFSKGLLKTFNPIKDRKNITAGCVGNLGINTFTEKDGSKSIRKKQITKEYGMRHNVWLGNTRGQEEMCVKLNHPAMMPKWIARDHILSWSNEGDLVLDPFSGSGTVVNEALNLKRNFIGFEINEEYFKLQTE